MPRCARLKSFDSIYHIMVRSISDVPLYKSDEDKDVYLGYIKKYQAIYMFKVYAYCIMDTHAHMIIDANGGDISKIMHCINQCYAQYYNRKYKRHGHLFQDRFKSKIVYEDRYVLSLSAYIHNNPDDLKKYRKRVEKYIYSSLGIYLGIREDKLGIVDTGFILSYFSKDTVPAVKRYIEFMKNISEDREDTEFINERCEYRSERRVLVRNIKAADVIDFVSRYINGDKSSIHIKYIRDGMDIKSLSAFLMRELCDMSQKDICCLIGNISQSHASKLCLKGYSLINEKAEYRNIVTDFLNEKAS